MTRPNYLRGWKMPRNERSAHPDFSHTQPGVRISAPKLASCSGACEDNAADCPTKEACQQPEEVTYDSGRLRNWGWVAFVGAIVMAALYGVSR
jgi:hypothetical protein